jgi:hypothetical protein
MPMLAPSRTFVHFVQSKARAPYALPTLSGQGQAFRAPCVFLPLQSTGAVKISRRAVRKLPPRRAQAAGRMASWTAGFPAPLSRRIFWLAAANGSANGQLPAKRVFLLAGIVR